MKLSLIITTLPSEAEAERMARDLVERRLAACVQIERITSVYRWEGVVQGEGEFRLSCKTSKACSEALMTAIGEAHPYDEPEVIAVPIEEASGGYAAWVEAETAQGPTD
jgi:periplasmic divalent cation tolerance protein